MSSSYYSQPQEGSNVGIILLLVLMVVVLGVAGWFVYKQMSKSSEPATPPSGKGPVDRPSHQYPSSEPASPPSGKGPVNRPVHGKIQPVEGICLYWIGGGNPMDSQDKKYIYTSSIDFSIASALVELNGKLARLRDLQTEFKTINKSAVAQRGWVLDGNSYYFKSADNSSSSNVVLDNEKSGAWVVGPKPSDALMKKYFVQIAGCQIN